jgi:hypothetical protein
MKRRLMGVRQRFFLKKEAKTFATDAAHKSRMGRRGAGERAKVFWFFFSKKNILA